MLPQEPQMIVLMGVSGCGKSSVGEVLSSWTGVSFYDGDDFHPQSNRKKMSQGIPLDDADREPWLQAIVDFAATKCEQQESLLVACSALKRVYRDQLRTLDAPVTFVHLTSSIETIHSRLTARKNHFMPVSLLESQFQALESPQGEDGVIEVSVEQKTVQASVSEIAERLSLKRV